MGILIGERELNDMFGDTVIDVAVYGGLQLSDNVKSFLSLPSGFRIYDRIEMIQAKKKAEITAVTERWDIRDRAEREDENVRMSPDELRTEKDKEFLERRACTKE